MISLSLGFPYNDEGIDRSIGTAVDSKVLIFAAASNEGANTNIPAYPARDGRVICVNSAHYNGAKSGDNPMPEGGKNLSTLGENVLSAWPKGLLPNKDSSACTHRISGSSVATTIVASIGGLVMELLRQDIEEREMSWAASKIKTLPGMSLVLRDMAKKIDGFQYIEPFTHLDGSQDDKTLGHRSRRSYAQTRIFNKLREEYNYEDFRLQSLRSTSPTPCPSPPAVAIPYLGFPTPSQKIYMPKNSNVNEIFLGQKRDGAGRTISAQTRWTSTIDCLQDTREKIQFLKCPTAEAEYFVPSKALGQILTTEVVSYLLSKLILPPFEQEEIIRVITQGGRKVFAILLMMREEPRIMDFAETVFYQERGLDSKLPYDLAFLSEMMPSNLALSFFGAQWEFIPPIFGRGMGYRQLNDRAIIPIEKIEKAAEGGFSIVDILTFYPGSSDFDEPAPRPHPKSLSQRVIRKRFSSNVDIKLISNERRVHSRLQHPNLIELLGSYSFRNTTNLLFPLMDGDLGMLLATTERPEQFRDEFSFLRALSGLSSGIEALHYLGVRHRDIKPTNILTNGDLFVLANFGHSELRETSDDDEGEFHGIHGTFTAPESDGSIEHDFKDSVFKRSSDIWSLGCVMAEVATYLFADSGRGVDEFKNRRKSKWGAFFVSSAFHTDGRPNPGVTAWLAELTRKASPIGVRLIKLITDMLCIDPRGRPNASDVTCQLQYLAFQSKVQTVDDLYSRVTLDFGDTTTLPRQRTQFRLFMRAAGLLKSEWLNSRSAYLFTRSSIFYQGNDLLSKIGEQLQAISQSSESLDAKVSELRLYNEELADLLPE